MDKKNPNPDNPKNFSAEELFKLMDTESSDHEFNNMDEFEKEAFEGLKMIKNREKVFELDSKIDAILEEEDRKKALIIPKKNNRGLYYIAMAASVALIIGFFFFFQPFSKPDNLAMKEDKSSGKDDQTVIAPVTSDVAPPPPESNTKNLEQAPTEKAVLKNDLASGENKGPVVNGNGDGSFNQEIKTEKDKGSGFYTTLEKKENLKTAEGNSGYTAPVAADELLADDVKNINESVANNNANNVSVTTVNGQGSVVTEELSKRKEEESEKQTFSYYKDLTGGMDKSKTVTDSVSNVDIAKNNSTNSNSGFSNTPTPGLVSGATTTTSPTYSWSPT